MNLTDYLPPAIASIVSGSLIGVVDHQIAKAESLIPQSLWQLAKRYFLNQPIRAQLQEKGNNTMAFIDDLEKSIVKLEELAERGLTAIAKLADFAGKVAPVAAAVAPLTGSAAGAVATGAAVAGEFAPVVEQVATAGAAELHAQQGATIGG